ncbi:MAG: endonuclease MutS2 [Ruminococcaceae bacterium]|nr:endonuclease MutS2 [Oscillospiraceae bacterium]
MKKEYKKLELDKVLTLLAENAWSDQCKEKCLKIEPVFDLEQCGKELKKTDDAFVLSSKFGTPRFSNIKDVCSSVKRAYGGATLSLRELLDIAAVLREISGLCSWYSSCGGIENTLQEYFDLLVPDKSLQEAIENAILSEEDISDSASPELSRIRRSIARQSANIREQLNKLIKSQETKKYLQESLITQRDGRFVVPVKVEHKSEINGLVHDVSSSGATLFIEPISVVEANNEIRVLEAQEQAEIERIIKNLSQRAGERSEEIIIGYENAIKLEMYFAKSNLGAKMKATTPELTEEPMLFLNKARHPLIDPKVVVPTTIELGTKYSCLIITGPNTGGKTVSIKTAGLLVLMTMCGLMIPTSDGSRIGIFSDIRADIGDEQSIEQSLSTFSSHMNNIISILKDCGRGSLILLDELGSGTDPVEGAALAVSILKTLKDKGCFIIATTHYQEVKMFAIEEEGVENACCEFDVATLQPTYKLIIGVPGKSNAFAIVRRLGMNEGIIDSAQALVGEENKRFERVVEDLEKSRQELELLKDDIAKEQRKTAELTAQIEKERAEAEKAKEFEISKARQQAMSIVEEVRFEADLLMEDLEKLRKEKAAADFAEKVKSSHSKVNSTLNKMYDIANPVTEKKNGKYVLPRPLKLNDKVILMDIDREGTVVSLPDGSGNCFVMVGIIRTKTNVSNLKLQEQQKNTTPNKKGSKGTVTRSIQSNADRKSSMELDIRGMTSDEGIMEVDGFIDSCLLGGIKIITIIHGKGTGALREAVHRFLKQNKYVKTYRLGVYGEGEAGVTVVELK